MPKTKQGRARLWARRKAELLAAYGGQCECCSEQQPLFLTLDHVNGRPPEHRKAGGSYKSAQALVPTLRRLGWPSDYRLLCWNCNCGRQLNNGVCPHKT